jgi:hypothetical protein
MALNGQAEKHLPQRTHFPVSITSGWETPLMQPAGHTDLHPPQPTHTSDMK